MLIKGEALRNQVARQPTHTSQSLRAFFPKGTYLWQIHSLWFFIWLYSVPNSAFSPKIVILISEERPYFSSVYTMVPFVQRQGKYYILIVAFIYRKYSGKDIPETMNNWWVREAELCDRLRRPSYTGHALIFSETMHYEFQHKLDKVNLTKKEILKEWVTFSDKISLSSFLIYNSILTEVATKALIYPSSGSSKLVSGKLHLHKSSLSLTTSPFHIYSLSPSSKAFFSLMQSHRFPPCSPGYLSFHFDHYPHELSNNLSFFLPRGEGRD